MHRQLPKLSPLRFAIAAGLAITTAFGAQTWAGADTAVPATAAAKKASLIVLFLYDESCKESCQVVRPVVRDITKECADRVNYVELNTSKNALGASIEKANSLKLKTFVEDRTEEVPLIGIFSNNGKKPRFLNELVGKKTREVYKDAIEKALEKVAKQ